MTLFRGGYIFAPYDMSHVVVSQYVDRVFHNLRAFMTEGVRCHTSVEPIKVMHDSVVRYKPADEPKSLWGRNAPRQSHMG